MDQGRGSEPNRSMGGCNTCRKRHLKCDQTVPICNRCQLSGLACEAYSPSFRWIVSTGMETDERVPQTSDDGPEQHSRRQLYTDKNRISMCTAMVADVPSTVGAALTEVEDRSKTFLDQHTDSFAIGPFAVFKPSVATPASAATTQLSGSETITNNDAMGSEGHHHDSHDHHDAAAGPGPSGAPSPIYFLDSLQWADLFTWDPGMWGDDPILKMVNGPPQPGAAAVAADAWRRQVGNSRDHHPHGHGNDPIHQLLHRDAAASSEDTLWPEVDLLVDAPLLLSHFNDHVISQMGSLPVLDKSPWKILNLQSAMMTMSQLTVLKTDRSTIKHASLSNFFALIAVSAFHLSVSSGAYEGSATPRDHWDALSIRTYRAAKQHLKISLERESGSPEKARYKEQLMALHAVLATAFLSGNQRDARRYLTEQEKLIRRRGLLKLTVSRRARLLHHIYAWMRIVSESTHVLHQDTPTEEDPNFDMSRPTAEEEALRERQVQSGRGRGNAKVTLDNFLRLDPHQSDWDVNINSQKDPGCSVRDIHLADPRQGLDSMFMRIYGVPETWLSLVSQTTRLANVMDRLTAGKGYTDADAASSMQLRAARLEDAICTFASRAHTHTHSVLGGGSDSGSETGGSGREMTPHFHMLRALSSALVLFFYRRIRNINPWILQTTVTNVIDSLYAFNAALEQYGVPGPGTAWPAFIAGAEATASEHRQQIISWLDKAFLKSGFMSYRVSGEILTEVWRRRDESASRGPGYEGHGLTAASLTWVDICRDMHCWPMLC